MPETFGQAVRSRRKELGLTLRRFASLAQMDPANVSRMERYLLPPPGEPAALERIADALQFPKSSPERMKLMDLAAVTAGRIPRDIVENKELLARLPVLFRKLRIEPAVDRDQLDALNGVLRDA